MATPTPHPSLHLPSPTADCRLPTAHFVGLCGAGMKALAELLSGMGWRISGSDGGAAVDVVARLRQRGWRVHGGHSGSHLPSDTDVLVYSLAVPEENPERRRAAAGGVPQWSYPQMLGRLMAHRSGLCVAGTHGKSTTAAMIASLLDDAGWKPSAVIGAELIGRGASGWAGAGDLMVVESCEYRRSFLDLVPRHAVITGIEIDHVDCYGSLEEIAEAFGEFAALVDPAGVLLVPGDCPISQRVAERAVAAVRTFGRPGGDSDWWAEDVLATAAGSRFRLCHRSRPPAEISLLVPGRHNVQNALAAAAMAAELGVEIRQVVEGLGRFAGIARRFEQIGTWRGVTVIDDYAHHPTAVRATLETAREKYPRRRLWCAFQPHQVSRSLALLEEFARCFAAADEVLVLPVYTAREEDHRAEAVAVELVERVAAEGGRPRCRFRRSLDHLLATVDDESRPGDVLITMGAGDIDRVRHEFTR